MADVDSNILKTLQNHECYNAISIPILLPKKFSVRGYCRRFQKECKMNIANGIQQIIIDYYVNKNLSLSAIALLSHPIFKQCNDRTLHTNIYNVVINNSCPQSHVLLNIMHELSENAHFMNSISLVISQHLKWAKQIKRLQLETFSAKLQEAKYVDAAADTDADTDADTEESSSSCQLSDNSSTSSSHHPFPIHNQPHLDNANEANINQHSDVDINKVNPVNNAWNYDYSSSESESLSEAFSEGKQEIYIQRRSETASRPEIEAIPQQKPVIVPNNKKACEQCTFHNALKAAKCVMCQYPFKNKKKQQKQNGKQYFNNDGNKKKKKKKKKNRKPKWWICNECFVRNAKIAALCVCGVAKPLERNEWKCVYCTSTNHVNFHKCVACKTKRKYENGGDWQCKQCYGYNTKYDKNCRECNKAKIEINENKKKWKKYDNVRVVINDSNNNFNHGNNRNYNNYNMYNGVNKNENILRNRRGITDIWQNNNNNAWSEHVGKYKRPQKGQTYQQYNNRTNNRNDRNNNYFGAPPPSSHSSEPFHSPSPQQQPQQRQYSQRKHENKINGYNYSHVQQEREERQNYCNNQNNHGINNRNNVHKVGDVVLYEGRECTIMYIKPNGSQCSVQYLDDKQFKSPVNTMHLKAINMNVNYQNNNSEHRDNGYNNNNNGSGNRMYNNNQNNYNSYYGDDNDDW